MKRKYGDMSPVDIIEQFTKYRTHKGLAAGMVLGSLYPAIYMRNPSGLICAPFGEVLGVIIGVPTGFLMGFISGVLTSISPYANKTHYRYVVIIVGTACVVFCSTLGFSMFAATRLVIPATVIAGLAAIHVTNRMVNWWLEETGEKEKKKHGEITA